MRRDAWIPPLLLVLPALVRAGAPRFLRLDPAPGAGVTLYTGMQFTLEWAEVDATGNFQATSIFMNFSPTGSSGTTADIHYSVADETQATLQQFKIFNFTKPGTIEFELKNKDAQAFSQSYFYEPGAQPASTSNPAPTTTTPSPSPTNVNGPSTTGTVTMTSPPSGDDTTTPTTGTQTGGNRQESPTTTPGAGGSSNNTTTNNGSTDDPAQPPPPAAGLSDGAKIGIGVGIGMFSSMAMGLAFFLWWRRRKQKSAAASPTPDDPSSPHETYNDIGGKSELAGTSALRSELSAGGGSPTTTELAGKSPTSEMTGSSPRSELMSKWDGSSVTPVRQELWTPGAGPYELDGDGGRSELGSGTGAWQGVVSPQSGVGGNGGMQGVGGGGGQFAPGTGHAR